MAQDPNSREKAPTQVKPISDKLLVKYLTDPIEPGDMAFGARILFERHMHNSEFDLGGERKVRLITVTGLLDETLVGHGEQQFPAILDPLFAMADELYANAAVRQYLHPATPAIRCAGPLPIHYLTADPTDFSLRRGSFADLFSQEAPKGSVFGFIVNESAGALAGMANFHFKEDVAASVPLSVTEGLVLHPDYQSLMIPAWIGNITTTTLQGIVNCAGIGLAEIAKADIANRLSNAICSRHFGQPTSVDAEENGRQLNVYRRLYQPNQEVILSARP
jgi:hypothetical protein